MAGIYNILTKKKGMTEAIPYHEMSKYKKPKVMQTASPST